MGQFLQIWDHDGELVSWGGDLAEGPKHAERCATGLRGQAQPGRPARAEHVVIAGTPYDVSWFGVWTKEVLDTAGSSASSTVRQLGTASVLVESGDRAKLDAAIRERLEFEKLISRLSTHFIDLTGDGIDEGIDKALASVGEFCGVDRAYIFMFEDDGAMRNTHEWCAGGIEPQIDNLQHLPADTFPWWVERIRRNEVIHVPDVAQMSESAIAEQQILEEQSILSVVVVPALYRGVALGFVGFDSVREHKRWRDEDIALLRLVGEMLVSAMERKRSEERQSLLEQQLIAARSMEIVARLAGGIAHDFNNLLAIILNSAGLLKRALEGSEHESMTDDLLQVARQGAGLTRQLLIVGRREVVKPVVLDLNEVVRALATLSRKTLGENRSLRLEFGDDVKRIRMGLPQLEQVVLNLTMNARDAMPLGGEVTIATSSFEVSNCQPAPGTKLPPGHYVVLAVEDTGSGMTSDVAERAFEPFFTTKGQIGTGLGLSTVHAIVQQAGGHVSIESTLQKGTKVCVFLPAVEDGDDAGAGSVDARKAPLRGRGETVLVVEDSGLLRSLIRSVLEQHRYKVLDAGTPSEAVRICEDHLGPIDLVLTDVIMPEMSGCRLADLLQERFGLSRVLFMSGYDDHVLAAQGILPEGTHLLEKPFLDTELLNMIRDVLA